MPVFNMQLSIKQKFTIALLAAVLVSTLIVGLISQYQARALLTHRVESVVFPNILQRIRNEIDKEISVLEQAAQQMASDPFIENWMRNGQPASDEPTVIALLKRMQQQYKLTNASVVNRQSAHYWNQDGFLRVLQDDQFDGWFYAFRSSGQSRSKSLYTEDNVSKLFVNYQDINGIVASGIARTVGDFVTVLKQNPIGDSGFVYLVDEQGTVKLHPDTSLLEKSSVKSQYGGEIASSLLTKSPFTLTELSLQGEVRYVASSYIASAGWYVIAEVPKAEMYAELAAMTIQMLIQIVVLMGLSALLATWMGSRLTRPIRELAETFSRLGAAEATLDVNLQPQQDKELMALQSGFTAFLAKIKQTIHQISEASHELKAVTDDVADQSALLLNMGQQQASHTGEVADTIKRLSQSVNHIADNANQAAQTSRQLQSVSHEGKSIAGNAREAIVELNRHTQNVTQTVTSLAQHAQSIEGVLSVIKGVSEQTNLLALNAAIEAARAGEQGRGFAVVADEVRSLAQRTHESTDEISQTISRLQDEVNRAVELMNLSQSRSQEGTEAVHQNEKALSEIESQIAEVARINLEVADTTGNQAQETDVIKQNLEAIRQETTTFLASSQQVTESTEKLRNLADSLDALVSQYD